MTANEKGKAGSIYRRIRQNVDALYSDTITYAEFAQKAKDLWREAENGSPEIYHALCELVRNARVTE